MAFPFKFFFLSNLLLALVFSPVLTSAVSLTDLQNQAANLVSGTISTLTNNPSLTCYNLSYSLRLASQDRYTKGQVSKLQQFLKTYGYYTGPVGGVFGYNTEKAVKTFQRQYRIVSKGSYKTTGYGATGPKTRAKIKSLTCGRNAIPVPGPDRGADQNAVPLPADSRALVPDLNPIVPFSSEAPLTITPPSGPVSDSVSPPPAVTVNPSPSSGSGSAIINTFIDRGQVPFTILFNAGQSQGSLVRYDWNFGDDNSANGYPRTTEGRLAGHRFDNPGTYNVTLTVSDTNGVVASANKTITVLARPGSAKTYYLSASAGNDAWTGLCSAPPASGTCGPWKTITKLKNSASSISADGVQILFKRGDTFDTVGNWDLGSLLRPAPYYVTLGAYGSGAKPVFQKLTGTSNGTGLINASYTAGRGVILDNLDLRGSLWVRPSYGSGAFIWPGVQAITRYLSISGGNFAVWGSDGVVVEKADLNVSGINAVGFGSNSNPGLLFISQSNIYNSTTHCIYLSGSSHDVLVENNELHHCGTNPTSIRDAFTVHGQQDNLLIRGNSVHDNGYAMGIDANIGYPDKITRVTIENNRIFNQISHVFQLASLQDSIIRNNVIYNNRGTNQPIFWIRAASTIAVATNLQIYQNTIYGNSAGVMNIDGTTNDTKDVHFKTNSVSGGRIPLVTDHRTYPAGETRLYLDFSNNTYTGFSNTSILFVSPLGSLNLPDWLSYENGGNPTVTPIPTPVVEPTPAPTPVVDPTPTIDLSNGLAAYFSLDNFNGQSTTDSAGGRTASCGAIETCPIGGAGKVGGDLLFNGTTTYLSVTNDSGLNPSSALSISAWLKPLTWNNGNRRILQKGLTDNQYRLTAESGVLRFHIAGKSALTTGLPPINTWSHLAAIYDGAGLKLYLNGSLVTSNSGSGAIPSTADPLFIGTKSDVAPGGDRFNGELDEIRLYNRALTLSEIQTLAGVPVTYNNFAITQMANAWQSLNQVWSWIWHQILFLSQWLWSWLGLHFN